MPTPPVSFLPIAALIIPEGRQRQSFDSVAIFELATSIKQYGLFHALLVRPDGRTLVAGERRLRAIRDHIYALGGSFTYGEEVVPDLHVPVIQTASDDPLILEEIELEENFRRRDLTWQEHSSAIARLHRLRQAQNPTHTVAKTAEEVHGRSDGDYQNTVRKEVILAEKLGDPDIAKAKSVDDAWKVLKKKEDAERNRLLAAAVGASHTASLHQVIHGDCLTSLPLETWAGKFDVILTDPPYGMGADLFGDGAGRLTGIDHDYNDSYESWQELMAKWVPLTYQLTKPQAHAYVFCDFDRFHELKEMMQKAGWYVFRTPLINFKRNSGRVPLPDQGPRRQYEICLYAIKGKKPVTGIYSDVIESNSDEQMSHGAQKPVELYVDLLKRSARPGDLVLDTFAGTGTIFPAAHSLKCVAVGVERNPVYYGLCVSRLKALSEDEQQ